jgi:hypothetical protein
MGTHWPRLKPGAGQMSAMRSVSPATRVELKSISEARNHARSAGHSSFGDRQAGQFSPSS